MMRHKVSVRIDLGKKGRYGPKVQDVRYVIGRFLVTISVTVWSFRPKGAVTAAIRLGEVVTDAPIRCGWLDSVGFIGETGVTQRRCRRRGEKSNSSKKHARREPKANSAT